ncbi:hypothetical protein F5884DRAFT_853595 [Xylogone sp. PMI_703]|nr:hypothetical protein F5884DRAFT_853595 [Xylogone sp. PMI_703]
MKVTTIVLLFASTVVAQTNLCNGGSGIPQCGNLGNCLALSGTCNPSSPGDGSCTCANGPPACCGSSDTSFCATEGLSPGTRNLGFVRKVSVGK